MKISDPFKWISYCPDTGAFTYKTATPDMFEDGKRHMTAKIRCGIWNTKNAGRVAGAIDAQGYTVMSVANKMHKAHRLAFLLMTGSAPQGQVDHINGDRSDNRWCNLLTYHHRTLHVDQRHHRMLQLLI